MTPDLFPGVGFERDVNARYTTTAFMTYIKRVAGVEAWDLDVDACTESHWAPRWFSKTAEPGSAGVDSLSHFWGPPGWSSETRHWRVFINPPFDDIEPRLVKMWALVEYFKVNRGSLTAAMVLPANRCEQPWWQEHVEPFIEGHERECRFAYQLTVHSPPTRQAYGVPGNREGIGCDGTPWPSCVLVWR
jgi:hypothetical protein